MVTTDSLCSLCLAGPAQRRERAYDVNVCQICWNKAANGWPQAFEATLRAGMGRSGSLIPDRNARGLYPRTYTPPEDHAL